jgi:hypothetical protein
MKKSILVSVTLCLCIAMQAQTVDNSSYENLSYLCGKFIDKK